MFQTDFEHSKTILTCIKNLKMFIFQIKHNIIEIEKTKGEW